jgi:preprotein translocase subunit SecG
MKTLKKETILMLSLVLFSLLIPITSAEILIGQTSSLYNIGDNFDITIKIKPSAPLSDFLIASLVCDGTEINIYKSPQSLAQGEEKEVKISARLDTFLVQDTEGECHIEVSFGEEEAKSQEFEVTNDIGVSLNIQGILFGPGETVSVSGKTDKANGNPVDGFVELSVPEIGFSFTGPVKDGVFNVTFRVPEDAISGSYDLTARAYEKDVADKITNEGSASARIKIKQVVKEIGIALSDQTVSPNEELTYSIILYDQAGEHASGDVSVKIYKPEGSLFDQKILKSDESSTIPLISSSPPGYWKIETKYENFETSKQFLVEELRDLSFTLVGSTLIVENTGNIPFTGPIEIGVGDKIELRELSDLKIGESLKYELKAPDGDYTIEVSEGSEKQTVGTTFLTGRAITIQAAGDGSILTTSLWVLVSLIALLVIALAVVYLYKRLIHGKSLVPQKTAQQKKVDGLVAAATSQKTKQENQNLIDKGVKQDSSIISLHIKNMSALESNSEAVKIIDAALWKAKEVGAKIYADGNYRIIILNEILTKEKENEMKSIHTSRAMERVFMAHNRKSAQKIEFGLGINSGTLIVEASKERFRFMSLNNVIAATKRISESASSEVLISESVKNRVLGKVKTTKLHDKNLWRLERVVDRSAYADHINSLTKK